MPKAKRSRAAATTSAAPAAGAAEAAARSFEEAARAAVAVVESDAYPAELGSLWLSINTTSPANANVVALLPCAGPKSTGVLKTSSLYDEYARTVIDDSDGCSETSEDLLELRADHKAPADALPALLGCGPDDRRVRVWSSWLKGVSWAALKGEFVRAHEVNAIAEKAFAICRPTFNVGKYHFIHPGHEDFLDSVGLEVSAAGGLSAAEVEKRFKSRVVCFWDREANVDISEAVGQALHMHATVELP